MEPEKGKPLSEIAEEKKNKDGQAHFELSQEQDAQDDVGGDHRAAGSGQSAERVVGSPSDSHK